MTDKRALEEDVKVLKRHFGGMAALVKELKAKVESLEKNQDNVAKIMDKQRIVEEAIKSLTRLSLTFNFEISSPRTSN